VSWLDDLSRALTAARIPSGRRRRILDELADHLDADPSAVDRLGEPAEIAQRFADEVGTSLVRRAAFATFLALAPLGLLFGVFFALFGVAHYGSADPTPMGPALILGTQLAFVGGVLALLRAWRLRRATGVTAAQATVLVRRALLGLGGGVLTVGGLASAAITAPSHIATWFVVAIYATAVVGAVTLAGAATLLVRAHRLRPIAAGAAQGDLASDLGMHDTPWRLALKIAVVVALCIAVAGLFQHDPFDGLARAVADGLACLAGFAVLGRWLGLR
jgi:MFS family permease